MTGDAPTLDSLVIQVRADTSQFMAGVGDIRRELDGPLAAGVDRAAGGIERALTRALITGKFGFDDLRKVALSALADIAAGALRADLGALFGGGGGAGSGGVLTALAGAVQGLFGGSPGRATGGPVTGGRAYMVGERGPELFVPNSSGRVEASTRGSPQRDVRIAININAPSARAATQALQRSSRQVASAVRRALRDF